MKYHFNLYIFNVKNCINLSWKTCIDNLIFFQKLKYDTYILDITIF